nr:ribonuclease H-like domain-containing protein [Tanacetum cinerariifolium]GEY74413.1 ribonuclease H-like domain-containing protein [Tanacetum cinerariifolium]
MSSWKRICLFYTYDDGYKPDDNVTLISKVDVSNSLHLHHHDSATVTIVSVKPKRTENYQVWSCAMLLALEGKYKIDFIDRSCRRLGHPNDQVLKVLKPNLLFENNTEIIYDICQRAKHTKEPFPLSDHVSIEIGELVHLNLDVKFVEDIVPVKKNSQHSNEQSVQDLTHLNIFNSYYLDNLPNMPNDEFPICLMMRREGTPSLTDNLYFAYVLNKSVEPKFFWESSKHQHWVDAMNTEMDDLYRNNNWELAELPEGRKAIGSKWVFTIKYKSDRETERYKARLVAKGYNQREGINFDKTFTPVEKIVTIRCLINLAVQNGWTLYQMHVNNVFFYGDLSESIYMSLPPSCFHDSENKVCKLNKSLYGLKKAPRQ